MMLRGRGKCAWRARSSGGITRVMTHPKPKPPRNGRQRTHKLQVYLSDEEAAFFRAMLERYNATQAELVRTWIRNASIQWRHRHASKEQPPPADPRQLTTDERLRVAP